jgi:hypothetical protein
MTSTRATGAHLVPVALTLTIAGCAGYRPTPIQEVPGILERAETRTENGITATVVVLGSDESKKVFGVDLGAQDIQPVWIKIENTTDVPYALVLPALDPSYYAPREAAYKNHRRLRAGTNERMDRYFDQEGIPAFLPPRGTISGFAFTNLDEKFKYVNVVLFGPGRSHRFVFYAEVPGMQADYERVDFDALYGDDEIADHDHEEDLRAAIEALPCCTTRRDGAGEGDPMNVVLIGKTRDIFGALVRRGWHFTEPLTAASAWRTFKAFFGGRYRYSPFSVLYFLGRGQDMGLQKARDTIHERNHMRLWLAPMRFRGKDVWVGTITRDIGIYFTTRAWNLMTHAIDPDVDEARRYLSQDTVLSDSVGRIGFAGGVGAATETDPHRNLMNAPWWTDGLRLVMLFSPTVTELDEVKFFYWRWGDAETTDRMNRTFQAAIDGREPPPTPERQADVPAATFRLKGIVLAAGVGMRWGEGELEFRGKTYRFQVRGFGVVEVGVTETVIRGEVYHLKDVSDFAGTYVAAEAGVAAAQGRGGITARNEKGVVVHATSETRGASLTLGAGGVSVTLLDRHCSPRPVGSGAGLT